MTRSAVTFLRTYQLSANVLRVDPSANGAVAFALKTLLLPRWWLSKQAAIMLDANNLVRTALNSLLQTDTNGQSEGENLGGHRRQSRL